jgi:hypothetical protein
MRAAILFTVLALLVGCATSGGGGGRRLVGKPKVDRCAEQPKSGQRGCEAAREKAVEFARRLSVDDQICIDGAHRIEEPGGACRVRAFVESTAPNGVKLEIREAPASSKYQIDSDWWFAEEAIAELQLRALGYALPGDEPAAPSVHGSDSQ